MRGLIINADHSSVNLRRRWMTEVVNELRKFEQKLEGQLLGRPRRDTRRCRVPIGPLAPNGKAAASGFTQDQRLGPADTPGFEDGETLPSQGMEGMSNLSPSQRFIGNLGSSR
jgi:hypothetical protein